MWWARRRAGRSAQSATATAERSVGDGGLQLDELLAEASRLADASRAAPSRERERRLLRLRHRAGIRLVDEAPPEPAFVAPDEDRLPDGDPLPEIPGDQLTAGLIRAGVLRDGCLLVRGLIRRDLAQAMAEQIERGFADRARQEAGSTASKGQYEEFQPDPPYGPVVGRGWIAGGGGLLAADAPRLHFEMTELFQAGGLPQLVSEYLGEPALISVHKTTLRKAEPQVTGAWHQDGYFMGDVRSLNLWLPLSRCGDVAPGLDLLPRRLDGYLATNTDDAPLDYTISQRKVDEAAGELGVIRPIFEPGDALLFDERFLHQTGSDPAMPNPRYAIENWFFGGSRFPEEYAPVAI